MPDTESRHARERQTFIAMLEIYCQEQHASNGGLCAECEELLEYSMSRLEHCPYQGDKPTCAKCPTHCYKPVMREKVRQMMRTAGPRMLFQHPLLAIQHMLDGLRKTPPRPVHRNKTNDN